MNFMKTVQKAKEVTKEEIISGKDTKQIKEKTIYRKKPNKRRL